MSGIRITRPKAGATVSLWTPFQRRFAECEAARKRVATQDVFIDYLNLTPSKLDHSIPQAVVIAWEYVGIAPKGVKLTLTELPSGKVEISRRCTGKSTRVYNLKINCRYRITLQAGEHRATREFFVADEAPRWLNVPGATNVRDCGGRTTTDGRRVKQNLLFRGSEFDRHHHLKPAGRRELLDHLKLRTDLDVRGGTEIAPGYTPPLDQARVAWVNIPLRPYDMIFTDEQRKYYADCLKYLSCAEHLPAYFHCWGCADRGGTLAFLLMALLGVPESELLADYEFTTCSVFAERRVGFKQFVNLLETLDKLDSNLAKAAEKYFLSGGATRRDVANFRKIMLED